jgi:hypothetical protein
MGRRKCGLDGEAKQKAGEPGWLKSTGGPKWQRGEFVLFSFLLFLFDELPHG